MFLISRTQCLLSPFATAFTSPTSNANSRRKRPMRISWSSSPSSGRRIKLSTFISIYLALITLFFSPSAYANSCIPEFTPLDENGDEDGFSFNLNSSEEDMKKTEVVVREGASFRLSCDLNQFHYMKWTVNNQEVTSQIEDEWNMRVEKDEKAMDGYIYSELTVFNASTKFHSGVYKCTPICHSEWPGSNLGVKVTVSIAIKVTIDAKISEGEESGRPLYRQVAVREGRAVIACTAYVPDANMSWFRITDRHRNMKEDMREVCSGPDVELSETERPRSHCTVNYAKQGDKSVLKLEINRVRQSANLSLNTISDFRTYECKATSGDGQDGRATVELIEKVSATRAFAHRGLKSLSVVQGEKLEIYCDITGIEPADLKSGKATVVWYKDEAILDVDSMTGINKISRVAEDVRGKPYQVGFSYDLADSHHRGYYTCEVIKEGTQASCQEDDDERCSKFKYYVRVKDKLGALWPFLGICGEVVILCTIILIYEKRRSKAELDESDTDGSPDQNNVNSYF